MAKDGYTPSPFADDNQGTPEEFVEEVKEDLQQVLEDLKKSASRMAPGKDGLDCMKESTAHDTIQDAIHQLPERIEETLEAIEGGNATKTVQGMNDIFGLQTQARWSMMTLEQECGVNINEAERRMDNIVSGAVKSKLVEKMEETEFD